MLKKYFNEETKVFHTPEDKPEIFKDGLGCLMFEKMKLYGNNVAQIEVDTGKHDLYSSYLSRSIRTAIKMKSLGLEYGDVIRICSHNHLNNSVPAVAALFLGIKIASLDQSSFIADNSHLVKLVKPKLVFVSTDSEKMIEEVKLETKLDFTIVVFGESERNLAFKDFLQETSEEQCFEPKPVKSIEDDAFVAFSSGSTGLPKGIQLSHKYFIYHCTYKIFEVVYSFSTLVWISAIYHTITSIINGTTKVVCAKLDYKMVWEQAEKFKVTHMVITPSDLIACYVNRPIEISLKVIGIGGNSAPYNFLCELRKSFPKTIVLNSYNQTEVMFCFNPVTGMDKPGCVGSPVPGRMIKVVDPETEETLGFHQQGELRVKTEYCFSGLYNQDSKDCWDKDGYFKTGDIFYYDEDFCFFFVERLKEIFMYRSFHVIPAILENVLLSHPEVKLAAVVGVPHEFDDNHPLAVVVLQDHAEVKAEQLRSFVDEKVDNRHKLRAGVKIVKELPPTPSGKIKRRDLVRMYMSGNLDE